MLGNQGILSGKIAFGEAEVMNSIQEVGLAFAVASANTNKGGGKAKLLVEVVFKLENRYGIELKVQGRKRAV